jgi:hypothetical protein
MTTEPTVGVGLSQMGIMIFGSHNRGAARQVSEPLGHVYAAMTCDLLLKTVSGWVR